MTKVTATCTAWADLAASIEWASDWKDTATIIRRIVAATCGIAGYQDITLVISDEEFALLEEPIVDGNLQEEFIIG